MGWDSALVDLAQKPTDVALDRLVNRIGGERVLAALDRLTAPTNGNANTSLTNKG